MFKTNMDKAKIKRLTQLTKEINDLTTEIKDKYPELYPFLEEDTLTLTDHGDPEVHFESFTNYLDSLKQMKKHYIENQEVLTKEGIAKQPK